MSFAQLLAKRLFTLTEEVQSVEWKNPRNPNYDRQWAEDALFHTIGPMTDAPTYTSNWSSRSEPVPGFQPKGPAPRWTEEEMVYAMAGDPAMLFKSGDHPRAPSYGTRGGAPLWRLAKKLASKYGRPTDKNLIADLYSNGFIKLTQLMKPGYDEARSPFISFAIRSIESAMEHGVGGNTQTIRAQGGESKSGVLGLEVLLAAKTPEDAMKVADQIQGKYQSGRFHDKHEHNPFGPFSSKVYQVAVAHAEALKSGNPEAVEKSQTRIRQLSDEVEESETQILGASTGVGQAISTPDRVTSVGVSSINVPQDEGGGDAAGNLPEDGDEEATVDTEAVEFMLDIALAHDITKWLQKDESLQQFAMTLGWKPGERIGPLTANELRCLIRHLGPMGSRYPGKGTPRANVQIPRDGKNWWKPMEDPEIEPIPAGGTWKSIWSRNGFPEMGPTEISREFTEEVREFQKLGIPTARQIKAKAKVEEVISKVAISNTTVSAITKLKLVGKVHASTIGLGESVKSDLRADGMILLEDLDPIDRRLVVEACDWMIRKVTRRLAMEGSFWEMAARETAAPPAKSPIAWSV
jgi:hypothetical protein